jgi:hypothetical protein
MDTLLFAGLLAIVAMMYRQRSRRVVLLLWHHITGGLGLGLTW